MEYKQAIVSHEQSQNLSTTQLSGWLKLPLLECLKVVSKQYNGDHCYFHIFKNKVFCCSKESGKSDSDGHVQLSLNLSKIGQCKRPRR
jgi:hypothetical protein